MLRLFSAWLCSLLLSLIALSTCAKEQQPLEAVTLQLKYQHDFQFAGYYAAKEQGYYQDAGLDVTISAAQIGNSATDAVISGDANYGVGMSSLLLKHSRGMPVVTLAVIFQHSPFTLLMTQDAKLSDIKGRDVLISKNAHDIIAMLAAQGIKPNDYQNVSRPYRLSELTESSIAAMSGYSLNEPHKLNQLGFPYKMHLPRDYGINFYGDNIFTTRLEITQHPERTQRFIQASLKGWKYAINHQEEIAQLIIDKYHSSDSIEQILFAAKETAFLIQPNLLEIGHFTQTRWQHIVDVYASLGLLPQNYNFSSFLYQPEGQPHTKYNVAYSLAILFVAFLLIALGYRVFTLLRMQRRDSHEMRFMNSILKTQQQASIDGILTFDAKGKLVSSNKQLIQLWKFKQNTLDNKDPKHIVYHMLRQLKEPLEFISVMRQHAENPTMQSFSEMSLRDGRTFERFSAPLFHDDKSFLGRFWSFRDITERKLAEEHIWLKANFDSLTELPNRFMFKERLSFEIKKAHRSNKLLALLFLDIDRFKEINDSLGHDVGDQLLVQVASRLKGCVRDIDMVSRLGGDEFTVILNDLERTDDVELVAEKILTAIAQPFTIERHTIYISTSIGITFSPLDSEDDIELLKSADLAMYHAKTLGRNNYQYFTPSLQVNSLEKIALTNDLRQALDNDELSLVYQPVVCLSNHDIVKAEALIRWEHPKRGSISPATFIPIAEETGLINSIGEWVFQQAVLQVKDWRAIAPNFQVSINTSPVQYQSDSINPNAWHQYLAQHRVPNQALIIELTETLLLESNESILNVLSEFRAHGTPVALDDFGTGYSSLSYLKKFDIDFLKIDRSFVDNLGDDSKDAALCQAIITMASSLGMEVIAEGIETNEHRALLTELQCGYGQGYLFSKPITPLALTNLLVAEQVTRTD